MLWDKELRNTTTDSQRWVQGPIDTGVHLVNVPFSSDP